MKKVFISFGLVILMVGCLFGFKKYQFNQLVEKNMSNYVSTKIVDKIQLIKPLYLIVGLITLIRIKSVSQNQLTLLFL
ncbi:hypothetical protein BHY08_04755 [Vagococcus teuberi]|uniref:Lipoprotein n=1 Tax=Vagococcus teuberi TaxID=519472 RepID=A0A1J0A5I2_9ENTE|nr:hypothetical protein BHY08_04755 [Vagococcus teuberi]